MIHVHIVIYGYTYERRWRKACGIILSCGKEGKGDGCTIVHASMAEKIVGTWERGDENGKYDAVLYIDERAITMMEWHLTKTH